MCGVRGGAVGGGAYRCGGVYMCMCAISIIVHPTSTKDNSRYTPKAFKHFNLQQLFYNGTGPKHQLSVLIPFISTAGIRKTGPDIYSKTPKATHSSWGVQCHEGQLKPKLQSLGPSVQVFSLSLK